MTTTSMIQAQNGKASNLKKTFSVETGVSISINADPSIIWTLLTQASDFPRWNSTIIEMNGTIAKGEKVTLKSTVDSSRVFKVKVTKMLPEKEMVWADGMAPFFRGVRTYSLSPNSDGSTTFSMVEKIGGLMFPMAAKHFPDFAPSFEQYAADLKKEAELIQSSNN